MYVLPVEKAVALGIWSCVSLPSFLPGHPDPRVGRGGAGEHPTIFTCSPAQWSPLTKYCKGVLQHVQPL